MSKFVHLHTHSHYSLLDGLPKIDELVKKTKELGMDAVALTDHGNLYGAIEFYKKARIAGVKPIIGVEAYLAPKSLENKNKGIDEKYSHLILLVKNNTGWKNLIKLVTRSYLKGFYYKPRIDKNLLREYSKGLIALSGCVSGEIPKLILRGDYEGAKKTAEYFRDIFGADNFFLEIGHHPGIPETIKANQGLKKLSGELKIPLVATQDIHYLTKEDAKYQDILLAVQTGNNVGDADRLTLKNDDFSMRTPEEMHKLFKDFPDAAQNTVKIADRCKIEIELGKIKLPKFRVPEKETANNYLKKLIDKRVKARYPNYSANITERIAMELGVIEKMGFADYFLIVQDFVNWAKERGIVVGPGRGSAAGSIISYILGITDIDPIKYNLIFERFLNPERIQMPDIDIDVTDVRRDEVLGYLQEKYGEQNVAHIITFGTMAARAAVRDVGRALGMSYGFCDQIAKLIPFNLKLKRAIENITELAEMYKNKADAKKLLDSALHLEGVARHASVHACGIVITKEFLTEYLPLQRSPQDPNVIVSQFEMHAVEDLGLLKIDLLGLRNLTIIENTIRLVNELRGEKIDISNLPLDDEKTFKLLQNGNTTGVFQLECLAGETIVSNTTIKKLYEKKHKKVLNSVYLDGGKIHKNRIINVLKSGVKDIYTLVAENGWYIKSTKDHSFLTENGWKKLKNIKPGEKILIKTKARHLAYNECNTCGKQINGQKDGQAIFCYKCSATFYRNPSKAISKEKIRQSRIKFYQQGGKPWNIGITAETSEKWKETAAKISKALMGVSLEERWGKEKAQAIKAKLSKRFSGKNNPMFGKPVPHSRRSYAGIREDLGHYVRSNWEADFARILKLHNTEYEYEPKTFPLVRENGEIVNYTPDFFVRSTNTFYEIKGWMHDLDEEKIKLFQRQYPEYNFVLINKTKFAEFALKYKKLIKWECPRIPIEQSFQFLKVKGIKYAGREETYDITMAAPGNNFVANGFVVHNSSGITRYLKDLKPTEFNDIIAMISLYRPGPMELIPEYIARKHGKKPITYLHPKLEPILKNTYGIMIYQEQLLNAARVLAGLTLAEADILRKAVGKKIKRLLLEQKEKFIKGCIKKEISQEVAEKFWKLVEPFDRYGFNLAHATSYAMIGYQTAYLKAYYPVEFMTSLLNAESKDIERIAYLVGEAKKMGIEILAPDINKSLAEFAPEGKNIRFGLLAIKNVGQNIVNAITENRQQKGPFEDLATFLTRIQHKDLNKKSLESLIKCGALDSLGTERNKAFTNIEEIIKFSQMIKKEQNAAQAGLFGQDFRTQSLRLKDAPPATPQEKLAWEKELLGLFITDHPLNRFKGKIKEVKAKTINELLAAGSENRYISLAGVVVKIQRIVTKMGKSMLFAKVEDFDNSLEIVVFPETLLKNQNIWKENNAVLILGKMSYRNGEPKLICESVSEL